MLNIFSMDDHYPASNQPAISEYGYSLDDERARTATNAMASNNINIAGNSQFPGKENEFPTWETADFHGAAGKIEEDTERFLGEAGKSADPRVVELLENLKQLYVKRRGLFKKLFPGIQDELEEVFKKFVEKVPHVNMDRVKVETLQRSLSVGSPRSQSKRGGESPLRLERFKVRTLNVGGVEQGGGRGDDTKSTGSK